MNILGNAIKFTPECGLIRCLAETVSIENGVVTDHFIVEDNGYGMDVFVTDVQMPGMNGAELIRRIRENSNYRHTVIIANTQYEEPGQEEKLIALGANDFIYKPTDPDIVRINNALYAIN